MKTSPDPWELVSRGRLDAEEAAETLALDVEHVVLAGEGKRVAAEHNGHVGQSRD